MTHTNQPFAASGEVGWGLLAAGVLAWDCLAPETLSNSFRREKQKHPILVIGALAITAAHLLDIFPTGADPIQIGYNLLPHRSLNPV